MKKSQIELKRLILDIELALSSVNNCVVTDNINAKIDEHSWRIDHTSLISRIQRFFKIPGNDISLLCVNRKKFLLTGRLKKRKKHFKVK